MRKSDIAGALLPVRYIGDLSSQDATLLQTLAQQSQSILEFGCGGSTQIFAQSAPSDSRISSVETDPRWIERTKRNFGLVGIPDRVNYLSWKEWERSSQENYDLIFDDGVDKLRLKFARRAWSMLRVEGRFLFHDTRRRGDFKVVSAFLAEVFLEVSSVLVNTGNSNITVITKQVAQPWEDWNVVEKRAKWEYGHAEPPLGLWGSATK